MTASELESVPIRNVALAQLTPLGSWQLSLSHHRDHHLLLWITRGQGVALLDGVRSGVSLHSAIFVPAQHLMAIELGRQSFGQAAIISKDQSEHWPDKPMHIKIRETGKQTELVALLDAVNRELTLGDDLLSQSLQSYANLIAIWLQRYQATTQPEPRKTAARKLMQRYCRRLVQAYADGSSMADHANALGVTPTHLTRVCKSETGLTAAALLTQRLLHAARTDLVSTRDQSKDIAHRLGFGSSAYFSRFIQVHTGQSPTALRRAAQTSVSGS